jgi:hypothetical protein
VEAIAALGDATDLVEHRSGDVMGNVVVHEFLQFDVVEGGWSQP